MVFFRMGILVLLVGYSLIMGGIPVSQMNALGKFSASIFFVAAPALYFLPSYEAWSRRRKNLAAIALVDIFLGWTLVGWVVSMAWALSSESSPVPEETKKCHACAETIKAEAKVCRYCGTDVSRALF